jgi:hypothetical protein
MATAGIYYLNAPSLSSATAAYDDAALTIPALDGFYSDGATVRELIGGLFTNVISPCAPCAAPCSVDPINVFEGKSFLEMTQNVGETVLDVGAIVIEIDYMTSERPIGLYFEYDGVQYNALSSQNFGFVQGPAGPNQVIYIGDTAFDCGILAAGFQPLPVQEFNPVTNTFDNTGQFLSVAALAPQIQLSPGTPGKYVMVIPKIAATPSSLYFQGRLLCNLNDFNITINCPTNLPSFTSTENCVVQIDTCALGTNQIYHSADVNGTTSSGGFFGLYDWVFSDSFGQTVLPDGWYRSPSVPSPDTSFEVQDGVIIGFGACAAVTGWNIDYEVENTIAGTCSTNVSTLKLSISQPPIPAYLDINAPATGTITIVAGLTHVQLRMDWLEVYTPCGQVRMVIEKDGVIIASKTLTTTSGTSEYLDVDFDLTIDAVIYGYVTLA